MSSTPIAYEASNVLELPAIPTSGIGKTLKLQHCAQLKAACVTSAAVAAASAPYQLSLVATEPSAAAAAASEPQQQSPDMAVAPATAAAAYVTQQQSPMMAVAPAAAAAASEPQQQSPVVAVALAAAATTYALQQQSSVVAAAPAAAATAAAAVNVPQEQSGAGQHHLLATHKGQAKAAQKPLSAASKFHAAASASLHQPARKK